MPKKRSEVPALSGAKGSFPMPSYYGLTGGLWSKIEKFALENHDLKQRAEKVQRRRYELQQELQYQQQQLEEQRALAARHDDPDPDDTYLRITEKEIRKCDDKARALARAAEIAFSEFLSEVNTTEFASGLQTLREMGDKYEQEYRHHIAQAEKARDELGSAYSMHRWLRGEMDINQFGPIPPSDYASRPWYTRPLDWGDEPEDPTISTQTAPGLVGLS
jgi:hypothetical protein